LKDFLKAIFEIVWAIHDYNNTYELAHFNGKEFEKINNDKFKHFPQWLNYCSKGVTTK
jgi:hypothetical protein